MTRLVLMGNYYYSKEILRYLELLMKRMGLSINKEKTSILHINKSSLYDGSFQIRLEQQELYECTPKY